MPLPPPPTRRLDNAANRQADRKADNELLLKGALCVLIGGGVLVAPYIIASPGVQQVVAQASVVGWFALVLGCGFIAVVGRRRLAAGAQD